MDQYKEIFQKYKIEIIILSCALFTLLISFSIFNFQSKAKNIQAVAPSISTKSTKIANDTSTILIDVEGAVESPDVYEIPKGKHVKDAINIAGGLSENADIDYVQRSINKAQLLINEEKIYIPSKNTSYENVLNADIITDGNVPLININDATLNELDTLPGIGQATGQKIIDNRPYTNIQDLLTKKIIGQSVFDKVKELINVN